MPIKKRDRAMGDLVGGSLFVIVIHQRSLLASHGNTRWLRPHHHPTVKINIEIYPYCILLFGF
jgi:hypothetical protein